MSSVRVLVVEDFAPLRQVVCSTLEERPELQVVGEASDGLEAVQKAEALQPDLILLDIGLPSLNGIEAARRITKLSPNSKILFVSQESSEVVAQEALRVGAGYVVKQRAGSELLAAVKAVCQGGRFVSTALSGFIDSAQVPDLCRQDPPAVPLPRKREIPRGHDVQFYSNDTSFLVHFGSLIEAALKAANAVLVIVTESHQKSLLQRLQAHGVDLAAAMEQRSLILLDAAEVLAKYMEAEGPNRERFLAAIEPLIRDAEMGHAGLVVLGEAVGILCAEGRMKAAIGLEQLWNELAQNHTFQLHCAYRMIEELKGEPHAMICAEHSAVLSAEA
jgi:DNA-binding NarL/FixJ family response regulator